MTLAQYRKKRVPEGAPSAEREHVEKHPGPLEYMQIGLVLAVITAIEVAIYYMGLSRALLVVALLGFSAAKFSLVVLWFMHLKFDHPLFSSMFLLGFMLAAAIFAVALATVEGKLV